MGWIIAGAIVVLIIDYIIALEMSGIAESKGCENPQRYLWFSFLLGLPGWIMVIALPDRNPEKQTKAAVHTVQQEKSPSQPPAAPPKIEEASPKGESTVVAIAVEDGKIKCPKCGTVQNANRLVCWECGAGFKAE